MNYGWLSSLPPIVVMLLMLAVLTLVIVVFVWNKRESGRRAV